MNGERPQSHSYLLVQNKYGRHHGGPEPPTCKTRKEGSACGTYEQQLGTTRHLLSTAPGGLAAGGPSPGGLKTLKQLNRYGVRAEADRPGGRT